MTREKADKDCLSRDCSCVLGKDRDCNYHEVIDKIYDDFDSQICSNCAYLNTDMQSSTLCDLYIEVPEFKDFGCNKWMPNG